MFYEIIYYVGCPVMGSQTSYEVLRFGKNKLHAMICLLESYF